METLGALEAVTGGYVGAGPAPTIEPASLARTLGGAPHFSAPPKHLLDFSTTHRRAPFVSPPSHPPSRLPHSSCKPSARHSRDIPLPRLAMMSVITPSILRPQIDAFFARLQPVLPVFSHAFVLNRIERGDHLANIDFATMLIALSSYALIQISDGDQPAVATRTEQAKALMGEAVALQASVHSGQAPTLDSILTSFFLFGCLCKPSLPFAGGN